MGKELGEDLGPEFDEMVDAVERGEDPAAMDGEPDGAAMMSGDSDAGGLDDE